MIRVFVAVDLSSEARLELGKFIGKLLTKRWLVAWEDSAKLHFTLFFIGWVDEAKIEVIKKALEVGLEGVSTFSIRCGNFGVFPDFVQPRVVWLGIKGDQQALVHLRKKIVERLEELGFVDEKRAWVPHLTIGRVKKEARFKAKKELGRQLRKLKIEGFKKISFIDKVTVYQSILKPSGSEYQKLFEIPLV